MPGVSNLTLASTGSGDAETLSRAPELQNPLPCVVGLSETGVTSLGYRPRGSIAGDSNDLAIAPM